MPNAEINDKEIKNKQEPMEQGQVEHGKVEPSIGMSKEMETHASTD
jgi:hypothetical protein